MTITITHTHAEGTLLDGSRKGDGVWEIAKLHGWAFSRNVGIYIRGSRDRVANRAKINGLAQALRDAGHDVTVEIDDQHRDRATVLADQAERLDDRRDALKTKADRRSAETQALWDYSDRLVEHIPPGQPILVGHHSERRHRRTLERSQNAAFKALEVGREAEATARRAAAVGKAAAHSETPAVTGRRIERLETELRDITRKLDGHERVFRNHAGEVYHVEKHGPAQGDYRETLIARREQILDQLDYDRATIAEAIQEGRYVRWSRDNIRPGDVVRVDGRWHEVVRASKVTVSVKTGYSWTGKVRYTDIIDARTPDGERRSGEGVAASVARETTNNHESE
jgi:Domain of unknown function (DUF3560)